MAIRIHQNRGIEPMPDLQALLNQRKFTIEGDAVMCPHCFNYHQKRRIKNGRQECLSCEKAFYVLKKGPFRFLTSKEEIKSGNVAP